MDKHHWLHNMIEYEHPISTENWQQRNMYYAVSSHQIGVEGVRLLSCWVHM